MPSVSVLPRLLDAGAITAEDVVTEGVRTVDVGRSNVVAVVLVGATPRLVTKTDGAGAAEWEQGDPAVERRLLEALGRLGAPFPDTIAVLDDVLVTAAVDGAGTLTEQVRDGRLPAAAAARTVGTALGRLHAFPADTAVLDGLPTDLPWGLRLLRDGAPRFVAEHAPAAVLRDELRRRAGLVQALARLAEQWSATHLVHGDLRWDNCLVDQTTGEAVLVDWECAVLGDPAWDLGCAVAEQLGQGPLFPTRQGGACGALDDALAEIAEPLRALGLAFSAAGGPTAEALRPRAATYAAARLLHMAFQWTFWDLADGEATARTVCAVVEELLDRPAAVADLLTGMPG
jgi:aminoglycoside phosphotransferase (APT) family kinase protein